MQFNYSECDTEIEALAKSQRQIRAKKIIIVLIRTNLLPFHRKVLFDLLLIKYGFFYSNIHSQD